MLYSAMLLLLVLLTGCANRLEQVILLPDKDGHIGIIEVQTGTHKTELTEAYSGARLKDSTIVIESIGQNEVDRRYGKVLEGLPRNPQRYILNFELGTSRLTVQSRAMLPGIQNDLKVFTAPEVVVIGHADATGSNALNEKLSIDRANLVSELLVAAGIPRDQIQRVGRGSREPLFPAKQGMPEPRNRRVEIKIR